jgi:hypothetical protein
MKVGSTGKKGKRRRGGITLFNRVTDTNAVDIFLIQHRDNRQNLHVFNLWPVNMVDINRWDTLPAINL